MDINIVEINVRFNEQDEMGVVHNSVYYVWFEIARYNFAMQALGITYDELKKTGILVPVIHSECQYRKPARFPDNLIVKCFYEPTDKSLLILHYEVIRKNTEEILSYGKTINAFITFNGNLLVCMPEIFKNPLNKMLNKHPEFIWDNSKKNRGLI